MKRLRETSSSLRVVLLLVAVWAVWLLAFVAWGWSFSELRADPNVALGYTVVSIQASIAVAIGLVVAIRRPGWGEIAGGLLVTFVAAIGSQDALDKLVHWGEGGVVGAPERTTPWVPLDSIGSIPYWVLLVAGVLLLVGGIVHVRHPAPGSTPHVGWRRTAVRSLREASSSMRVVLVLVAVWAVWLLAFVVWAWSVPEWGSNNFYIGYTVLSVVAFIVAGIGVVAAIRWPGWGEIGGGLVVTLLAQWGSRGAVTELRNWGEIVKSLNEDRGSPWVPLDSLDLVPYWVLLVAGVLLLVGGIVHVLHPTHGSTPHAGAAA